VIASAVGEVQGGRVRDDGEVQAIEPAIVGMGGAIAWGGSQLEDRRQVLPEEPSQPTWL
jgi:hypothetical protein